MGEFGKLWKFLKNVCTKWFPKKERIIIQPPTSRDAVTKNYTDYINEIQNKLDARDRDIKSVKELLNDMPKVKNITSDSCSGSDLKAYWYQSGKKFEDGRKIQ